MQLTFCMIPCSDGELPVHYAAVSHLRKDMYIVYMLGTADSTDNFWQDFLVLFDRHCQEKNVTYKLSDGRRVTLKEYIDMESKT